MPVSLGTLLFCILISNACSGLKSTAEAFQYLQAGKYLPGLHLLLLFAALKGTETFGTILSMFTWQGVLLGLMEFLKGSCAWDCLQPCMRFSLDNT